MAYASLCCGEVHKHPLSFFEPRSEHHLQLSSGVVSGGVVFLLQLTETWRFCMYHCAVGSLINPMAQSVAARPD